MYKPSTRYRSADEERDLAERFQQHNDLEAARQLVLSHLRFVVRVARGYRGYGLQEADLIQEGNIGLMKAVKRFDPSIGVRLLYTGYGPRFMNSFCVTGASSRSPRPRHSVNSSSICVRPRNGWAG